MLSDHEELNSQGENSSAQEVYVLYRHTFDLGHFTGRDFSYGPIRGAGFTVGFDADSKSGDAYQSEKRMLVAGPTVKLDVPGFLNASLLELWESNAPAAHPTRYYYRPHPMLSLAWGIPFGSLPLSFDGYANFIAAKGTDEFGTRTRAETNIDMQVMWDVGSAFGLPKKTFKIGAEYQYWRNKFGNDSNKDSSGGSTARTPMIRAEYHF